MCVAPDWEVFQSLEITTEARIPNIWSTVSSMTEQEERNAVNTNTTPNVAKKTRTRGGHRGQLKKLFSKVDECLLKFD